MIWLSGVEGGHGGTNPEAGADELPPVDAATDGEAMAQGSFGEADFDAMMVESGGLQTAEISNPAVPQHDAEAESNEDDERARYHLPPLDRDGFQVSDLVWAKLEGHPWWPGEIFDPSDASELALKHQKEGHHLVAFYGDGSFAWCHESQFKPFMENRAEMEKQCNSDAFAIAVNGALQELSRRILAAASCSCLPEELSENGMSYIGENAGLKTGFTCSKVNQAEILKYFSPEHLLHYMKLLALSPCQGGVLQDLVIACSQLMSFYRSKGYAEIASFQSGSAWAENNIDTTVTNEVQPSHVKPKRGRGRPRKRKPDDNVELTEGRPIVKPQNGPAVHNNIGETECGEFDISMKKPAKRRRVQRRYDVDPKDLSGMAASTEMGMIEKTEGDGSEEWKMLPCPKEEITDHMQDAYWSGLSLHTVSTQSLKGASGKTRPIRRRRATRRTCAPSSDLSSPVQNMHPETLDVNRKIEVIKRSIIHVDEKMLHDVNPTALVFCFGKSIALPSKMDFIRMFSRYGPLKETETETHKNTNTVKVVFRKRVDAERAFSAAGNFGSFGPSLRSFRLVNMPFSLRTTELSYPMLRPEDSSMEIPVCRVSGVALDYAQIDIFDKADKGEAVKNPSVEHTEMVKLAGQGEGNTECALHAGGRNEESPDVLSDTMQTEIVDEAPRHCLDCVDGIVKASEDTMEVDNTDEAREETSIPHAFTGYVAKQSLGDEYTFEGIEGSTVEMPVGETRKFSCC
uniref:Predicted protein n=1 Tax=Hordeum vulgare subsp. vulgare TaxID=112509 RepID=F2D0Y2_HORVV|nr:predicted protein [Hordeum vulgare subsp. vulgare]